MVIIVSFKIRFHNALLKELAKVLAERRVIEGMVKSNALGILHIRLVRGYLVQDTLTLQELAITVIYKSNKQNKLHVLAA